MVLQPSDEVRINKNGNVFVDGKQLSEQDIKALADQVEWFRKSDLYRMLYGDIVEKAKQKLFLQAKIPDDLTWGKAMLYNKSVEEEIMNQIEKRKPKAEPTIPI